MSPFIPPSGVDNFKDKALSWASRFSPFVFLDSCGYADPYGKYNWLAATGAVRTFLSWKELRAEQAPCWLFGHLSYEAHRQLGSFEDVLADADSGIPAIQWFAPQVVVGQQRGEESVFIHSEERLDADVWKEINAIDLPEIPLPKGSFQKAFEKHAYCAVIDQLRSHIRQGDCYEINFCNARKAIFPEIPEPAAVFRALRKASPAPFAACYRVGEHWLVSASPERYLVLEGEKLISQPIKGTAPRSVDDPAADEKARLELYHSAKDRAENVMIVDLTRSDFARVCQLGSVQVESLFGIHSFPQVHQMISTISGNLLAEKSFWDAVQTAFPMGSMTGAPRQKVMDLIRLYEGKERGFFSGSVGFVDPEGHADLNVVIRSVWGDNSGNVGFNTGGAITWNSTPEGEWEECLLKGRAVEGLFL